MALPSVVRNPDQSDFSGNTDTSLMKSFISANFNVIDNTSDETCIFENMKDVGFPALKSNSDWQTDAHHSLVINYVMSEVIDR